jgi:hypothetical protein
MSALSGGLWRKEATVERGAREMGPVLYAVTSDRECKQTKDRVDRRQVEIKKTLLAVF